MEAQPVRESKVPSYPTRREVLAGAATFALANLCGPWRVFCGDGGRGYHCRPHLRARGRSRSNWLCRGFATGLPLRRRGDADHPGGTRQAWHQT